ncbi:hypothetical protein ACN42_g7505 [Penicillium freii]|uniref:Uncharacterized protein n=1 Tax=Penicillium freii TaxID=48697 RepID=A0A101MFI8_PENFR|nr:hypothetical protein ACN42_g7505 [Penicillium freii]
MVVIAVLTFSETSKRKKKMPSSRIELETFGCQSCYQECHMKGYETDVMTKLDHEGCRPSCRIDHLDRLSPTAREMPRCQVEEYNRLGADQNRTDGSTSIVDCILL